ncbi:hypothetical protein TWF730_004698 [Orbilia blumenaviensis]|uniref:Uncharacterized protein n=1 Tax=Orbilia blumenaviensis TaxID=1796055 RepID=A0AAV9TWR7_9PEZI
MFSSSLRQTYHLSHSSIHLPPDDICFIFLTSEDVVTDEPETRVIERLKLCEGLAKSRGIVFLKTLETGHTFHTLSEKTRRLFCGSATKPFLLPISKVDDLVPVLESFIRDFRAQRAAQIEKLEKLHNTRLLRSLNLLGEAVTNTKINERAVYGLLEAFPSMVAYSEECMDPNAKEKLSMTLMMDGQAQEGEARRMANSLVDFWEKNQPL